MSRLTVFLSLSLGDLILGMAMVAAQAPQGPGGAPGLITAIPVPARCPNGVSTMAFGEGSLWMSCHTEGPIWERHESKTFRIDPHTHETLAALPVSGNLMVGEGAVWLTEFPRFDKLHKIDPRTNQIVSSLMLKPGEGARMAAGEGGVWLSRRDLAGIGKDLERRGLSHVVRVDPQTNQVAATIPVDHLVLDLACGEEHVWILSGKSALFVSNQEVLCLDPHTNQVVATVPVSKLTKHLLVGAGWVWAVEIGTEFNGPPSVSVTRINPKTRSVEGAPIPLARRGYYCAAAGLGALWVCQCGPRGFDVLSGVNGQTGQVKEVPAIVGPGHFPLGLTIGDQAIWVGCGLRTCVLYRVQP
jgi:hypothetical protein